MRALRDNRNEIDWDTDDPIDRALIYSFQHDFELARDEYLELLESEPDSPEAYFGMSRLALIEDRADQAMQWIDRGLQRISSPRLCSMKALILQRLGQTARANEWLERGEALDGNDYHVVYARAQLKSAAGQHEEALQLFRRAAGLARPLVRPLLQLHLGNACLALQKPRRELVDEALSAYTAATGSMPAWEASFLVAIEQLASSGLLEQALRFAERGLNQFGDSIRIRLLAIPLLCESQREQDAIELAHEILELTEYADVAVQAVGEALSPWTAAPAVTSFLARLQQWPAAKTKTKSSGSQ